MLDVNTMQICAAIHSFRQPEGPTMVQQLPEGTSRLTPLRCPCPLHQQSF